MLMFSQLSAPTRILIRIIQSVNYGSVLNIRIVKGDASFDPPPDVLLDIRLDVDAAARAELALEDFTLSDEVRRLLVQIDALKNGLIDEIVVHAGLPRRVKLRSSIRSVSEEPPNPRGC
jgi:hypothetical protein